MINELYRLSGIIKNQGIDAKDWHREYKQLPKVTKKAPCIRIWLAGDGSVCEIESLDAELVKSLRKFGNNQGTFPAFNIVPLYRITEKKQFDALEQTEQNSSLLNVGEIRSWCVNENWRGSLSNKINNCLHGAVLRLQNRIGQQSGDEANLVLELIRIVNGFSNAPACSFRLALENCVFQKLETKQDIHTALAVLFHNGNPAAKDPEKDSGTLSVILDVYDWQKYGYPVGSEHTTDWVNQILLKSDQVDDASQPRCGETDAFGSPFVPVDDPMPNVRLKGFDVTLRTMFAGQPCQYRYCTIENASYPIGRENRALVKKSLEWIADNNREGVTWQRIDQNEIVFVYPSKLPMIPPKFSSIFGPRQEMNDAQAQARFEGIADEFIRTFQGIPPHEKPDSIQIFVVRKIDKARSKVIFTRNCSPEQLILAAKEWQAGCYNTTETEFAQQITPYPLQAAHIVNNVWKQSGELANQGKTTIESMKSYQGLELFLDLGLESVIRNYLHIVLRNSSGLVKYAGNWEHGGSARPTRKADEEKQKKEISLLLSLVGLLLYKRGMRKEIYMENMAYLVGQLLKISDEMHAFYCKVVRGGNVPPQLVGSSLFVTASEIPNQALAQLSIRMNPYITWAKQYRTKNIADKGVESWRAGWYIKLYEDTANKLHPIMMDATRFDDFGKAQFFIGYLASFPQKEKTEATDTNVENNMNEMGETYNEQGN